MSKSERVQKLNERATILLKRFEKWQWTRGYALISRIFSHSVAKRPVLGYDREMDEVFTVVGGTPTKDGWILFDDNGGRHNIKRCAVYAIRQDSNGKIWYEPIR